MNFNRIYSTEHNFYNGFFSHQPCDRLNLNIFFQQQYAMKQDILQIWASKKDLNLFKGFTMYAHPNLYIIPFKDTVPLYHLLRHLYFMLLRTFTSNHLRTSSFSFHAHASSYSFSFDRHLTQTLPFDIAIDDWLLNHEPFTIDSLNLELKQLTLYHEHELELTLNHEPWALNWIERILNLERTAPWNPFQCSHHWTLNVWSSLRLNEHLTSSENVLWQLTTCLTSDEHQRMYFGTWTEVTTEFGPAIESWESRLHLWTRMQLKIEQLKTDNLERMMLTEQQGLAAGQNGRENLLLDRMDVLRAFVQTSGRHVHSISKWMNNQVVDK